MPMRSSLIRLGLAAGALSLAAACGGPTPTPLPSGGVILQDDFSDVNSGWDRHTGSDITTDYIDGRYQIRVAPVNVDAWGLAGLDLNDMQVTAESAYVAGPLDNAFGVVCRYTRVNDQNNFYFFLVSSDGYYAMGKVVQDERTYLNPAGDFEPLSALTDDPAAALTLQATCQDGTFQFAVNGTPVGTFQDDQLTHGDVGVIAGTFNEGGIQIAFDNVRVTQP